jgi:uncharacterized membrane protein
MDGLSLFTILGIWRQGAACTLAIVFVVAGISKFYRDAAFPAVVVAFTGLGARKAAIIAQWLPIGEVFLGAGVLVPAVSRSAAGLLAILACSFLLGAIRAQKTTSVACGCFGTLLPERPGAIPWGRNLALVAFGLSVLCLPQAAPIPDAWLPGLALPGLILVVLLHFDLLAALPVSPK